MEDDMMGQGFDKPKHPIASWLSADCAQNIFDEYVCEFIVRKEMSQADGHLQEGMFLVFALESIRKLDGSIQECSQFELEVFALPKVGDELQVYVHQTALPKSHTVRIFSDCKTLLAVVQRYS